MSVFNCAMFERLLLCPLALIPVATTDTRIMPSSLSSNADPKIIVASGSTSLRIRLAASSTSNSHIQTTRNVN